ncbi:MAG: uroporphyrinogen decarboxylase [Elusimicrobia bacterium]|nr:uroporphyrinogen decarboxylase [Elusimicrobiota bacterium]
MPGGLVKTGKGGLLSPWKESLFLRACRREKTPRPPVWLMRQAGRYQASYRALREHVSMLELCKSPDLVAQVTVNAVQETGVDAAILFSDLLLPVEPLGLALSFQKGEGPAIAPAIRSAADVARLRPVDVGDSLGYILEAVRRTRLSLPADIPLLGFAGAPFTLAGYMIEGGGSKDFSLTKSFMRSEPKAWHSLLGKIARVVADLLNEQISAGVQAVQLFDSWVGVLSPSDYQTYAQPHTRSVFQALPRGVPALHFGTQSGALLPLMRDAGGTVIGLDWRVPLLETWKRLGPVGAMGNLDPTVLLSSRGVVRREVQRILAEVGSRPGFIFNLGHGILPATPFENVVALVQCVKEFSSR